MWYIRECGSKIYCGGCRKSFPGPVIDGCDHSNDTDDDIDPDHECSYSIPAGMQIEEIQPIIGQVIKRYVLTEPLEFLSRYAYTDFMYNEGRITVCQYCREIPEAILDNDSDYNDYSDFLAYLEKERLFKLVVEKYYEKIPGFAQVYKGAPSGMDIDYYMDKVRQTCRDIMAKQLLKLNKANRCPVSYYVVVESEARFLQEICDEFNSTGVTGGSKLMVVP